MPAQTKATQACPFCGLHSDVGHESQEGCIAALNAEISRMRDILQRLKPAGMPPSDHDRNADAARDGRVRLE
jgi:hypothetical protein